MGFSPCLDPLQGGGAVAGLSGGGHHLFSALSHATELTVPAGGPVDLTNLLGSVLPEAPVLFFTCRSPLEGQFSPVIASEHCSRVSRLTCRKRSYSAVELGFNISKIGQRILIAPVSEPLSPELHLVVLERAR